MIKEQSSILVVDDTPANLTLLAELLAKQGYRVRAAKDGATALRAVHATPPDLILLDISMPDMDGYEVCEHLKGDLTTQDIPVIFISALNDTEDILKAFEVGGVDYVTKPFKFKEVLARVESHLTLVHQRQQLVCQREEIASLREQDRHQFETINQLREQFIRAATHDLKNPLSVIIGYVGLLKTEDAITADENLREYVHFIERGAGKMLGLIQDMLELLQMQTSLGLTLAPTNLNLLIEEVVDSFHLRAADRNLDIMLSLPEMPIVCTLDRRLFSRGIENLVSNAIKYTPNGGRIEICLHKNETSAIIEVIDNGLGIPAADLGNLFQPFYRVRTKQHMNIEGTGLGLSIVKAIVEQHNGQIIAESEPGKGSIFSLCIPLN